MSTKERDTHFQNSAKLLWDKIINELASHGQCIDECNGFESDHPEDRHSLHSDDLAWIMESIITHFLFDFAEHVIMHQHGSDLWSMQDEGLVHFLEVSYPGYTRLPDMTEQPKRE